MIKRIITNISEEDFRKLNLTVYRTERIDRDDGSHRYDLVPRSINDILDEQIAYALKAGYASDLKNLQIPVTIAIHEDPTSERIQECIKTYIGLDEADVYKICRKEFTYLDKFMNSYTGAQTFQIGWGIKHLYSTRDYYEDREDYWRVRKDETKVIYRINLSPVWQDKFRLKHRTDVSDWPYDFIPEDVSPGYIKAFLCINYDRQEDDSWVESSRYGRFIYEHAEAHIPVDNTGHRKGKELKKWTATDSLR